MKLTEKIVLGILVVAVILECLLVPWMGVVMIISIYSLAFLYVLFGFAHFNNLELSKAFSKASYDSITTGRIIGSIALGFSHFFAISGVLLKITFSPGAGPCLLIGGVSGTIILIISLFKFNKNKTPFYKNAIKRSAVLVILSGFLFFLPSKYYVEFFMRNHPDYIEAYRDYQKDKTNEDGADRLEVEYNKATMDDDEFEEYMKQKEESEDAK